MKNQGATSANDLIIMKVAKGIKVDCKGEISFITNNSRLKRVMLVNEELKDFLSQFNWYFCNGYSSTKVNDKFIRLHRLVFYIYKGYLPKTIDHKNRDKADNTIGNLREASNSQNAANKKRVKSESGYKGVSKNCNGWVAHIGFNNKLHYIGRFKTPEEAAIAYNNKAIELFGEFAVLNEIDKLYLQTRKNRNRGYLSKVFPHLYTA